MGSCPIRCGDFLGTQGELQVNMVQYGELGGSVALIKTTGYQR